MSFVCYQVEVSALGRSLVHRSPTECDVFESDLEISTMRRSRSTRDCCAIVKTLTGNFQLEQASQVQSKARPRSPHWALLLGALRPKWFVRLEVLSAVGIINTNFWLACEAV